MNLTLRYWFPRGAGPHCQPQTQEKLARRGGPAKQLKRRKTPKSVSTPYFNGLTNGWESGALRGRFAEAKVGTISKKKRAPRRKEERVGDVL